MDKERWAGIIGLEKYYQVSTYGRIKRLPRMSKNSRNDSYKPYGERIMSLSSNNPKKYITAKLTVNGVTTSHQVHREVLRAFTKKNEWKREVNHKDGNKHNNYISNLEWMTSKENAIHAVKNGLTNHACGEKNGLSKLKEKEVVEIKTMLSKGKLTRMEISEIFPVGYQSIGDIARKKTWRHVKI